MICHWYASKVTRGRAPSAKPWLRFVTKWLQERGPVLGMGATICLWSDRHACTVVYVGKTGKLVQVQYDKAIRTDSNGMSDSQQYRYQRDPDGIVETYTLRKNGAWVRQGDPMSGTRLSLGVRRSYHDYSF